MLANIDYIALVQLRTFMNCKSRIL